MMNAMPQDTTAERRAWRNTLKRKVCSRTDFANNPQYVHTPYDLCHDMVERLDQYGSLHEAQTFLTLNLEFVETLCYSIGIEKSKIWFITECLEKAAVARCHPRYSGVNVIYASYLTWKAPNNMKFDVIVGNPPYNAGNKNTGNPIWPDFVEQSLSLVAEGGYLCLIHPSGWRKPEHELWRKMSALQLRYIKVMSDRESLNVFGAGTRVDWYVLQNTLNTTTTRINDELGENIDIDLSTRAFLPGYLIEEVDKILARNGEAACDVISRNRDCDTNKEHMAKDKDNTFKYPCINAINSEAEGGIIVWYSSDREKSKMDIPKVIVTDSRYMRPINDYGCQYGMAGHAFGIKISSKKEGDLIVAAIKTPKFQEIIKATKWGNFATEYKMFRTFKKDFWRHFVNEDGTEKK